MQKINIAELLKDCPKGMELDCAMYDNLVFCEIGSEAQDYPIITQLPNGVQKWFTSDGRYELNPNAKCIIFPKGKTTWEGFQGPFVDGDIVALDSAGGSQVFIFEEYIRGEKDYAHCYLMLDDDGAVDLERGEYYVERFASEEEKQKLFDAIKANGYKWNAETKTLEKLVTPKFKVGDMIRQKNKHGVCLVSEVRDNHYLLDEKDIALPFFAQDLWELVPNKFDITTLKPFDKVLVRDKNTDEWRGHFFSRYYNTSDRPYICIGVEGINEYKQCIPFKSNEHLLGKVDDCDEFYKIWE